MNNNNSNFSALFGPDQILCDLHDDRMDHAIEKLIASIGDIVQSIDFENIDQLIFNREGCGIMLVQPKVIVVHVRVEGLKHLRIALATSREGLICSSEHLKLKCVGEYFDPVNIAFLMMAPFDDPTSYLRAVAALKVICKREGFIEHLLSLDDPRDIWEQFEKTAEKLPDYLEARHIMRSDFSRLNVNDNLFQAIDLFCKENIGEYPVVDDDGDLVGIVSEDELIRLCLPEYITWIEDLSPILNFEPFAEILRHEKHMPVMDIMAFAESYATVDESAPAVQVAKVMMRRDVRQVFVVRNNKLMGIISINDLIYKVLRA